MPVIQQFLAPLQQWLLFAGATLAVGCVAWRIVVAPAAAAMLTDSQPSQLGVLMRRVARVGVIATLVLLVAWALRMVAQVVAFRDPFVPLSEDVSFLLFEMFWGTVWMAQGAIIVLLALTFWAAGRAARSAPATRLDGIGPAWLAAALLAIGLILTLSLSSHAMGVESWRSAVVAADAIHALAAGGWIGTLGVILLNGHAAPGTPSDRDLFAAQIRAFSPLAIVGVGALVVMGVILSWTHLTAVSDLWQVGYGRLLLAKIILAGGVLLAGFVNWRRGVPSLTGEVGARITWRRAAWEVFLAVGVLLLTAFLVHSAKP